MDLYAPPRPYYPRLDPLLDKLGQLTYRQRRTWLWHNNKPRLSRFLYKYRRCYPSDTTGVDRLRDVIVRSRLWLSSAADFNDPFDMSARVVVEGSSDQLENRLKTLIDRHQPTLTKSQRTGKLREFLRKSPEELMEIARSGFENTVKVMGVYSLAGDPKNILMWAHYAADHTGICLQFEVVRDSRTFLQAVHVDYLPDYPTLNWIEETAPQIVKALLRKEEGWSYEKEQRIIIPNGAHTYLPFHPDALTAIIFGCRSGDPIKQKIHDLVAERQKMGMAAPRLYVATKHSSEYALVLKRL
jgi:hypothetical protein